MIGQTIWRYDAYRDRKDPNSRPTYREHWVPAIITGETSRSWIVGERDWNQYKIPKKGPHPGWCFSEQEIDDKCWIHNCWQISDAVRLVSDVGILRQIAELIGWKPSN
jgi:hypothetical protein